MGRQPNTSELNQLAFKRIGDGHALTGVAQAYSRWAEEGLGPDIEVFYDREGMHPTPGDLLARQYP